MADFAFGSSSALAGGTRTSSTVTAPSGISNGNLLVCLFYNEISTTGIATLTGWTEWTAARRTSGTGNTWYLQAFYKWASGESGNYVWAHNPGSTSTWSAAVMIRLTGGAGSGDPLDGGFAFQTCSPAVGAVNPVCATITNTGANSFNIGFITQYGTSVTLTAGSSGYTVAHGANDQAKIGYAVQAASGASGAKTFSMTSDQWETMHFSLRDTGGGVASIPNKSYCFLQSVPRASSW